MHCDNCVLAASEIVCVGHSRQFPPVVLYVPPAHFVHPSTVQPVYPVSQKHAVDDTRLVSPSVVVPDAHGVHCTEPPTIEYVFSRQTSQCVLPYSKLDTVPAAHVEQTVSAAPPVYNPGPHF